MKLSFRARILLLASLLALAGALGRARAQPVARPENVEQAGLLTRRIQRLLPAMMSSLAAARRDGDPSLIRCFDRAVSELHSLVRQVGFHVERQTRAEEIVERQRHERALVFLSQRVDELAHSGESCFTEGAWVKPGETHVEVVIVRQN